MKKSLAGLTYAICAALTVFAAQAKDAAKRDWSEMFLAASSSLAPDGSFLVFEWVGRIWRVSPD